MNTLATLLDAAVAYGEADACPPGELLETSDKRQALGVAVLEAARKWQAEGCPPPEQCPVCAADDDRWWQAYLAIIATGKQPLTAQVMADEAVAHAKGRGR